MDARAQEGWVCSTVWKLRGTSAQLSILKWFRVLLALLFSHINIHQLQSFEFICEDARISPVIVEGNFSWAPLVQGGAGGLREWNLQHRLKQRLSRHLGLPPLPLTVLPRCLSPTSRPYPLVLSWQWCRPLLGSVLGPCCLWKPSTSVLPAQCAQQPVGFVPWIDQGCRGRWGQQPGCNMLFKGAFYWGKCSYFFNKYTSIQTISQLFWMLLWGKRNSKVCLDWELTTVFLGSSR